MEDPLNNPQSTTETGEDTELTSLPYEHPRPSFRSPDDYAYYEEEGTRLKELAAKRGLVITGARDLIDIDKVVAVHTLGLTAAGLPEIITDPLHELNAQAIALVRQVGHHLLAHPEDAVPGQRLPLEDGGTAMLAEGHEHDLDCLSFVHFAYDDHPGGIEVLRVRRIPTTVLSQEV